MYVCSKCDLFLHAVVGVDGNKIIPNQITK